MITPLPVDRYLYSEGIISPYIALHQGIHIYYNTCTNFWRVLPYSERIPPRVFGHNSLPRTLTGTRIGRIVVPSSLPELPKPSRASGDSEKPVIQNLQFT